MVLKVPADATVFMNGQKMSVTGTQRRFRIPTANPTKTYDYPVRVEVERNGKTLVSQTTHKLQGGKLVNVTVAESDSEGELVAVAAR